MGFLTALQGQRIYLDTNIWIYALEGYPSFIQFLTELFIGIDQGSLNAVTSELTLAEVLVKPLMDQNLQRQNIYHQALQSSKSLEVVPVSREVLLKAAELRAECNLKLPDAIHAATALQTKCFNFLTNDKRFQTVAELRVILLSQAASST